MGCQRDHGRAFPLVSAVARLAALDRSPGWPWEGEPGGIPGWTRPAGRRRSRAGDGSGVRVLPVTAKGRHDTACSCEALLAPQPCQEPREQPRPRLAREKRRRDSKGGGGWDERHQRESCARRSTCGWSPRRRRDAAASSHAAGEVPHPTCALWTGRCRHPAPFPGREAFVSQPSINHAPMWARGPLLALGTGRGMNE